MRIQVRCETPGTDQEVWMDFLEVDGKKYRLVDESECERERLINEFVDDAVDKPKKIEKLEWEIIKFNKGNIEMAEYVSKLSNKINEIIDHLNKDLCLE